MSGGKVLLLTWDGEQAWVQRITEALIELDLEIHQVTSPNEAWYTLRDGRHRALIILEAPEMAESCLVTRMLRERCPAPIIMLGKEITTEARLNYYRAGADLCMPLPFERLELLARLTGLWRRKEWNQRITNNESQQIPSSP